jgi:uncharacterized membrane protein YeaQ/YmgE (transglycosylase-associated protein family)
MAILAAMTLDPGGILSWLVVGLIAGFLASRVMGGGGYGLIGDIVVGLVGAFIGGFLFGQFATGTTAFVGSIVVAFVGACLLIWLVRMIAPSRASL